jgi:hypothetical protein
MCTIVGLHGVDDLIIASGRVTDNGRHDVPQLVTFPASTTCVASGVSDAA